MSGTLLLVIIGGAAVILFFLYVRLIQKRNQAQSALASIDVQLKKRRDLIPNILVIAKETMTKEIELVEKVTQLRAKAAEAEVPREAATQAPDKVQAHLDAEAALAGGMRQIFAVAENYPEPRFVEAMKRAQESYEEVEGHIAASRRFYNSACEELKSAVEIFPSSAIAAMLSIKAMPFFEISEQERAPVNAADFFKQ